MCSLQSSVPWAVSANYCKLSNSPSGKYLEESSVIVRGALSTVAVAVALGTLSLAGQTAPAVSAPADQRPQATFRSGVEVVTVSATVRDHRGRVIKDLKKKDFVVLDRGRAREIRDFHAGEAAVSLGVLLDISGSMAVAGNIERAREAIGLALANLQQNRDEAALFTFDTTLQEVRTFTTDLKKVKAVGLQGTPFGMTSLYDAVAATARRVAERTNRHRALLVVTDGVDTGSRMTGPQVSYIASSIDVPVYLLVVSSPVDQPGNDFSVFASGGATTDAATLADLARWTGGSMSTSSVQADTIRALQDVISDLRHQYMITFEPGAHPGWHPLEVRIRNKSLVVHARSGYLAGPIRSGT
jgi:Ca-activated chloride channel homolog